MDWESDQTALDLLNFLEWLDSTRTVKEWGTSEDTTHEEVAKMYCAERSGNG